MQTDPNRKGDMRLSSIFKRVGATVAAVAAAGTLTTLAAGTVQASDIPPPGYVKVCNAREFGITVTFTDRNGYSISPVKTNYRNCVTAKIGQQGWERIYVQYWGFQGGKSDVIGANHWVNLGGRAGVVVAAHLSNGHPGYITNDAVE